MNMFVYIQQGSYDQTKIEYLQMGYKEVSRRFKRRKHFIKQFQEQKEGRRKCAHSFSSLKQLKLNSKQKKNS